MSTPITNANAGPYWNANNVCQRSGFKAKPGELVQDAYGYWVLPEYAERFRHPQERVRVKAEKLEGARRPEPATDRLIENEYPDGVQASDL